MRSPVHRLRFALLAIVGALCLTVSVAPEAWAANTEELIRILLSDRNFKLRANAARLLGKSKDARGMQPLVGALSDDHPVVRSSACAALVSFDDVRVISELEKMAQDKDDNVRKACAAALRSLQRPKTTASTGARPALDFSDVRPKGAKEPDPLHLALRGSLKREAAETRGLFETPDTVERGYRLIGGVTCEDQVRGNETILFCKVNMVLARMPGKIILGSVGATGGATIVDPKKQTDRDATQRALFSAFAKSLVEDVVSVVNQDRAQNGEETLK